MHSAARFARVETGGTEGELIEWLAIVSESTCVQSDCRHRAAILRSRIVNAVPHRRQRGIQKGRRYTKSRPCPSVGGSVERFRVHDLRRMVRSGLARLQVPEDVAFGQRRAERTAARPCFVAPMTSP